MSNHISTIINIDSSNRNKHSKHIYENKYNNDKQINISLKKNSNIANIYYNNHNFDIYDNIVITDVKNEKKNLINVLYLLKNTSYAIIMIENNIVKNYKEYINTLYANIKIANNDLNNYYENIPFNIFTGIKKIFLYSDINSEIKNELFDFILDIFKINIFDNENDVISSIINEKFIFFNTNIVFNINSTQNYSLVQCLLQISFLDICGIELGYINANYPINSEQYQSSHKIINIKNKDNFEIEINKKPFNDADINNVKVYKVLNTIEGYLNPNEYNILLDRTYTNIINIELLSTEIPYVDIIIKTNINDKLYWKNLNDGNYLYSITIRDGFYKLGELVDSIKTSINKVKRNIISTELPIYNIFELYYDSNSYYIEFKSFENVKLTNSLFIKKRIIENNEYYILTISFKSNLHKGDNITINDSEDIIFYDDNVYKLLNKKYINNTHIIYSNNSNIEIDVVIDKINNINIIIVDNTNNIINNTYGGNINITIPSFFSLLFDKSDTVGEILGFRNINTEFSVTDYLNIITNDYIFINNIELSNLTNEISDYNNNILNLSGKYNYMLMFLNNIDYIKNKNLPSCFAKILLPSKPGTILFNTFVIIGNNNSSTIFPIDKLNELNILFLYPNGTKVNFKNLEHSFTIKIIEKII